VIVVVTFLILQEKDVIDAIEGRVGDNDPSVGADLTVQATTSQAKVEHQEQV